MASQPPVSYSLANELWSNVLQNLALHPLELGRARPTGAFCSNRAALRQLCLTSRRFLAMARPYLYEYIVLFADGDVRRGGAGADSLVLLVRALMQNHELRPLIKNLALPITLSTEIPHSKAACIAITQRWFDNSAAFTNLKPCDKEILDVIGFTKIGDEDAKNTGTTKHQTRIPAGEIGNLAQKIAAALLCLTPKVEKLLLQDLLTGPSHALDQALWNVTSHAEISKTFLPSLKTLQIQLDPLISSDENYHEEEELTEATLSSPLFNQPELDRVEIRYGWVDELQISPKIHDGIARLKDINLMVAAEPTAVDTLVQQATGVKSLSLGIFPIQNFPDQEGDINTAILRRSKTLENLALDTSHCSSEHAANQLGPLGRFTCLPQLDQLKRLAVEPHLLLDWLNANTWSRFFNTLPRNLEELTLRFVPENGEDLLRIWARSGIGAVLKASPEKWQSKMPHLKRVHLQPLPYSIKAAETIKEALQAANIVLTWQEPDLSLDFAGLSLK